ncbi:MerC family mercury resistance protein [Sphingobium scionense]
MRSAGPRPGRPRSWLDGFAVCASALCTVHCLGLPLLFALLPTIAARIDPGDPSTY